MTQIDKVSFDFVVPGEGFAKGLLSGWEPFCHSCFEQVADAFFAPHGQDGDYGFGRIELDLGAIPEEEFYEQYPRRLREALQRAVSFDRRQAGGRAGAGATASGHLEDILFGLKYGCPSATGGERDIDSFFKAQAAWLEKQPAAVKQDCINEVASLALSEDGALRRMILHLGDESLRLGVFRAAISKQDYTVWQKNRFLLSFLDLDGAVPVRFVHESDGKGDLFRMAELLDSGAVRKIMQIEMTRQAKPGLAYYWHYLYEWLLRYYPYNDISLFGGKSQFVSHLHLRFLTFLHKEPTSSYYSEYELTLQFLREVFGDQYVYVAAAIHRLLHQNVGNVTRYSRYGESLYLSFVRISLLHRGAAGSEDGLDWGPDGTLQASDAEASASQDPAGRILRLKQLLARRDLPERERRRYVAAFWDSCRESRPEAVVLLDAEGVLAAVMALTDGQAVREMMRQSAARAYSKAALQSVLLVGGWLQEQSADAATVRECLAPVATDDYVCEVLASVSLALLDTVQRVRCAVFASRSEFAWLAGLAGDALAQTWNRTVLLWLSGRAAGEMPDVSQLLELFHREVTGSGDRSAKDAWVRRVREPAGGAARPAREAEAEGGDTLAQLADGRLPEATRSRILRYYLENRPWELLHFIRHSVRNGSIPEVAWSGWLDVGEWRLLASAVSVSAAQSFVRVIESVPLDGPAECRVWVASLVGCDDREWRFNTAEENVAKFVKTLSRHCDAPAPVSARQPEQTERPPVPETIAEEVVSFPVGNAGLCLLAPWFVRLFIILGYLDPECKKFVDTYSRIRAVFLLQYLVYGEERRYPESDLTFNRLLADLPFDVPLPDWLPLTDEEKRTADEMLAGVKANWRQMDGTSVAGFRRSFVERGGRLKRREGRWTLVVEEKAFDVLLDTVPWGFRQIILPWIKGFVQVIWRNGQTI